MAKPWDQGGTLAAQRAPGSRRASSQASLSGKGRSRAGGGSLPRAASTVPV